MRIATGFERLFATIALSAALAASAATSLNVLRGKRLFSDEYVYTLISIGQFPGQPFGDDPGTPNPQRFWSSDSLQRVRTASHLETSNMFLYEVLLFLVIKLTSSTDSLVLGLLSVVPVWIAAFVLYKCVLHQSRDRLRGLAASTLFLTHPQIFYRGVDFRGYALALMFTAVVLRLTLLAIAERTTTPWRDVLLALCTLGAFFCHYNTAPYLLVCWLALLLLLERRRVRLFGWGAACGTLVAAWMYAGAYASATSPARYSDVAVAIQQDPNNFLAVTARNVAFAVGDIVRVFSGLSLFRGLRYRYQAFTIVLGVSCFITWLRLALGKRGQRPQADVVLLTYVVAPLALALLSALATGNVLPLRSSYQCWSIPVVISMFLYVLWCQKREHLRLVALLVVAASFAAEIWSYNGARNDNPYNELLERVRAGDVREVTVPSYYHAQFLFFHAGRRQQVWPRVIVDPRCPYPHNADPATYVKDAVAQFDEAVQHSYQHRRSIVLSLVNGGRVVIAEPLLFERAY